MANTHFECNECEAVFTIKHSLNKDYYRVLNCPFCGSELDNEEYDVDESVDE
jgi:transcription elongation factor Elf1